MDNEHDDQIIEIPALATWQQFEHIARELGVAIDPDVDTGDACIAAIRQLKNNGPELGDDPQVSTGDTLAEAMRHNRNERHVLLSSLIAARGIINRVASALSVSQWDADGTEIVEKAQRWSGLSYALRTRLRRLTDLSSPDTVEQRARISEIRAVIAQLSAPTPLAEWVADHPAYAIPPSVVDTATEDPIVVGNDLDYPFDANDLWDIVTSLTRDSATSRACKTKFTAIRDSTVATSEFISMLNLIILPYLRRLQVKAVVSAR